MEGLLSEAFYFQGRAEKQDSAQMLFLSVWPRPTKVALTGLDWSFDHFYFLFGVFRRERRVFFEMSNFSCAQSQACHFDWEAAALQDWDADPTGLDDRDRVFKVAMLSHNRR